MHVRLTGSHTSNVLHCGFLVQGAPTSPVELHTPLLPGMSHRLPRGQIWSKQHTPSVQNRSTSHCASSVQKSPGARVGTGVQVASVLPQKPICVGLEVGIAVVVGCGVAVGVHVPCVAPQKPTCVWVKVGVAVLVDGGVAVGCGVAVGLPGMHKSP